MYILCRAFQLLGLGLGGGGGMERLHWLLERAFDEDINQLSHTFTLVQALLPSAAENAPFTAAGGLEQFGCKCCKSSAVLLTSC